LFKVDGVGPDNELCSKQALLKRRTPQITNYKHQAVFCNLDFLAIVIGWQFVSCLL